MRILLTIMIERALPLTSTPAPTSNAGVDVVLVEERGAAPGDGADTARDATVGALPRDAEALLVARAVAAAAAAGYAYFLVLSASNFSFGSEGWAPALVAVLREAKPLANFGVALARPLGAASAHVFQEAPFFHRTHLDVFGELLPAPLLHAPPGAMHARGAARVLPWLVQAYSPCAVYRTKVVLLGGNAGTAALDSPLKAALAGAAAAGRARAAAWIAAMRSGETLVCALKSLS